MNTRWFARGGVAWCYLAAAVLAWDLLAADEQTLSEAFRRSREHPASAVAVGVIWGMLTAHLWGLLPQRADPLHAVHIARDYRRLHRAVAA